MVKSSFKIGKIGQKVGESGKKWGKVIKSREK